MNRSRYIFSFISFGIALFMFVPQSAFAGTSENMTGYAWSSNIGWISFNCTNNGTCSQGDYGVNESLTDGTLNGYAWSSNIGWIQFGSLSGFPTGAGTTPANAQVQSSALTGWARAVSAVGRSDGWDGWISLSGTATDASSYGISVTGGNFSGYAWGGPVVGWISFSPFGPSNPLPPPTVPGCDGSNNYCGITTIPPAPGFTLTCNTSIPVATTTTNIDNILIQANPTGGFRDSVSITPSSSSLPSGTNYSVDPIDCTSGSCSTTNFDVTFPALSIGNYSINVSGSAASVPGSSSCTINLDVSAGNNSGTPGNAHYQEF